MLGLCLSSHDHMCDTAVEILFSMIHAEYVLIGNFDTIETEVFVKLDKLVCSPYTTIPACSRIITKCLRDLVHS